MSLMVLQAGPSGPSGGGFTPADVAGLVLWLDASEGTYQSTGGAAALADGDPVGEWQDQSGEGNDATQATGTAKPTLKTGANGLNGLPVLRFDGTDDVVYRDVALLAGTECTVFAVAIINSVAPYQRVLSFRPGNWASGDYDYTTAAGMAVMSVTADGSSLEGFRNGASLSSRPFSTGAAYCWTSKLGGGVHTMYRAGVAGTPVASSGSLDVRCVSVGATGVFGSGLAFLVGDIAAVLVYDSALSDADREDVEAYLTDRYGL